MRAVGHQAESLVRVDQHDQVWRMRAQLFARRACDQRSGWHGAQARCLPLGWRTGAATRAEAAPEVPGMGARRAALECDPGATRGPVEHAAVCHCASMNKLA